MTPTTYETIGNRLLSTRKILWVVAVASVFGVVASILLEPILSPAIALVMFGSLLSALIISWGLLLTIYWFSSEGSLSKGSIEQLEGNGRTAKVIFSWYASVLLSLWFASGVLVLPVMLWRGVSNA